MSETPSSLPRLFAELKRRRVFRVMAVYGATAFVLLQAADLLAQGMGLSDQVLRITTFLVLVGFPIAVVLAWAFESTPDGVRRTEDATPEEISAIIALPASRRWPAGLLALAGVALLVGGWWIGRQGGAQAANMGSTTSVADASTAAASIAVLPFADLSEAGDQAWFADGLAEEILNSLAALHELKVTARTSSFQFRDGDRDITEIADTLGVAHVLKGSVRRIGDELIVTAQLIRAADGTHLWSNTYQRDAADLFDVQRDVAEKVAAALDIFLDDRKREAMFRTGTRDVEAFEAYLRGVDQQDRWHDGERGPDNDAGQAEFTRALALDPGYAEAALGRADPYSHVLMGGHDWGMNQEEAREALLSDLRFAAENARSPTTRLVAEINAELFSRHWYRMGALVDELAQQEDLGRLAHISTGWLTHLLIVANPEAARRLAEAELEANPLDGWAWWRLAAVELAQGDIEAATTILDRGRTRAGTSAPATAARRFIAMRSDPGAAQRWVGTEENQTGASLFTRKWFLPAYQVLGKDVSATAREIDSLPGGNAMFIQLLAVSGSVPFDLADTPNFAARLEEAGIDLSGFGVPMVTPQD
ncbi:MAG TPA: hypothetical protein VLA33_00190 [Gemmatimonadota bacterium]|nr:hypothetical protein [Gemmatimonadota bacterium]